MRLTSILESRHDGPGDGTRTSRVDGLIIEWRDLALDRADELGYPGKTWFTVRFYFRIE